MECKGELSCEERSFIYIVLTNLAFALQEEEAFNYAVSIYGLDDVAAIQAMVRTRTKIQVRNRTSKASLFSLHFRDSLLCEPLITTSFRRHFLPPQLKIKQGGKEYFEKGQTSGAK